MSNVLQDPTMRLFLSCASILVLKMLATGYVTSVLRNLHKVYATPEDYAFFGRAPGERDEQIERLRRAHRNDLEHVLPFLVVGFLIGATNAVSYGTAVWLFVPYTCARILHTLAYALGLQPWRSILFGIADIDLLVATSILLATSVKAP